MRTFDHLSDQIMDVGVEHVPKLPAKVALRMGAQLYEVVNRALAARAAEDVPYASAMEIAARAEAVEVQHAIAESQLRARAGQEAVDESARRISRPIPSVEHATVRSLFDQVDGTPQGENEERRVGSAGRRTRRPRGRKPRVRDSKVRLSKALVHFDRDANGLRIVTLHQLAELGAKIDLPLPYVLELLKKWGRIIDLGEHRFRICETDDVLELWISRGAEDPRELARLAGLSVTTVRKYLKGQGDNSDSRHGVEVGR